MSKIDEYNDAVRGLNVLKISLTTIRKTNYNASSMK